MKKSNDLYLDDPTQLNRLIAKAENFIKTAPEGHLRISRSHNSTQYYWKHDNTNESGVYIKRSNQELAQKLAQKEYAVKILRYAKMKREALLKHHVPYNWTELTYYHEQFSPQRQELIQPFLISNEEYARLWKMEQSNFDANIMPYSIDINTASTTNLNELVRSKSEKILADKFNNLEIPYIYEKPLYLGEYNPIYPDFTVLNKRTRKVFYWEHFGKMDDVEYANKTIKKLAIYQQNQIYPGDRLLITYESSKVVLNSKLVDQMIDKYLL